MEIGFYNKLITTNLNPAIYADVFESSFISRVEGSTGRSITLIDKTTTQLGEFSVLKSRYYYNDYINLELYTWM